MKAQRESRGYSSALSLTLALDGVGSQLHALAALPPAKRCGTHCTGGCVGPRTGLDGCEKSRPPTRIQSPDRPARSESLYRLSYRGPSCLLSNPETLCQCRVKVSSDKLLHVKRETVLNTSLHHEQCQSKCQC
jgi:hypothetical protein